VLQACIAYRLGCTLAVAAAAGNNELLMWGGYGVIQAHIPGQVTADVYYLAGSSLV